MIKSYLEILHVSALWLHLWILKGVYIAPEGIKDGKCREHKSCKFPRGMSKPTGSASDFTCNETCLGSGTLRFGNTFNNG